MTKEKHRHKFKILRDVVIAYQKGSREWVSGKVKILWACDCGEGRVLKWGEKP